MKPQKILLSILVILILVLVVSLTVYHFRNKKSTPSPQAAPISSTLTKQELSETNMFNTLNAQKINLNSVQYSSNTNSVIVRLKTNNQVLASSDVTNDWTGIYTLYTNYPTLTNIEVYVMSGSTQLLDIKTTNTEFKNAINGLSTTQLAQGDPSTVNTVLAKLAVVSTLPVSSLLK